MRKPETAPPRRATLTASVRLFWAAAAQRTLDFTAMYMPMKPAAPEQKAPTRKATPVRQPMSNGPKPSTSVPPSTPTRTPMMMAIATEKMAMVLY